MVVVLMISLLHLMMLREVQKILVTGVIYKNCLRNYHKTRWTTPIFNKITILQSCLNLLCSCLNVKELLILKQARYLKFK